MLQEDFRIDSHGIMAVPSGKHRSWNPRSSNAEAADEVSVTVQRTARPACCAQMRSDAVGRLSRAFYMPTGCAILFSRSGGTRAHAKWDCVSATASRSLCNFIFCLAVLFLFQCQFQPMATFASFGAFHAYTSRSAPGGSFAPATCRRMPIWNRSTADSRTTTWISRSSASSVVLAEVGASSASCWLVELSIWYLGYSWYLRVLLEL